MNVEKGNSVRIFHIIVVRRYLSNAASLIVNLEFKFCVRVTYTSYLEMPFVCYLYAICLDRILLFQRHLASVST